MKWPDTCTGASGVSVPEKTRTRLTRPTYWSLEVFTISATSWPRGSPLIGSATAAGRGEDLGGGVLERRREAVDGEVEQLGAADAGHRADRYDGVEARVGDGLLEVLGEGVVGDLLAAEVAVHQRLVLGLLDDPLDQGTAEVLVVAVVDHQVDQPGDLGAVADRDVERQHLVAERRRAAARTPS